MQITYFYYFRGLGLVMSWGRSDTQTSKPSVSDKMMGKAKGVCKCADTNKGMGARMRQTHMRNNNRKNQKIYM